MEARILFTNGNTLDLDEYATDQLLKYIHSKELNNSFVVLHFADKTGRLMHTVPLNSVSHIEYK